VVKNEIRRRFVGEMKVLARKQQYEVWKDVKKRQVTIRSQKNANKGNFGVNSDVKKGQGQNIR